VKSHDTWLSHDFVKEPYKRDDILQKRHNFEEPTNCSHSIAVKSHDTWLSRDSASTILQPCRGVLLWVIWREPPLFVEEALSHGPSLDLVSQSHTRVSVLAHIAANAGTNINTQTHTHRRTCTHTYTHTKTHKHTQTHTHTYTRHTHAHSVSLSLILSLTHTYTHTHRNLSPILVYVCVYVVNPMSMFRG